MSISRRSALAGSLGTTAAALSTAWSTPSADASTTPIPGVGAWAGVDQVSNDLANSQAHWYYTWAPNHEWITTPTGCEFVPMIWGQRDLTSSALSQAKSNGRILLGFNEPDVPTQANMSVQVALDAWPKLQGTGMTLGAPAVSSNAATPGGWLDKFMSGVRSRGYRVNFIPLHWYMSADLWSNYSTQRAVSILQQYLQATYNRYKLPIWLTEFSLIWFDGSTPRAESSSVQSAFMSAANSMMATLPYVQRWAWFSLTPFNNATPAALYDNHGNITATGTKFQSIA